MKPNLICTKVLFFFDVQEVIIPVVGGEEITDVLIGLPWLDRRLVVDRKAGLLTLGED